jgi:hypothetical protein
VVGGFFYTTGRYSVGLWVLIGLFVGAGVLVVPLKIESYSGN